MLKKNSFTTTELAIIVLAEIQVIQMTIFFKEILLNLIIFYQTTIVFRLYAILKEPLLNGKRLFKKGWGVCFKNIEVNFFEIIMRKI